MKAEKMMPGRWYRTVPNKYGRFVAGSLTADGKHIMVFLDGDTDMQSCLGLRPDDEVEPAETK